MPMTATQTIDADIRPIEELHVAWHPPVCARGEGKRDFRTVRDAVAFILGGAETSDELAKRVVDLFGRMFAGKRNSRHFAQLVRRRAIHKIVKEEEVMQLVRTEPHFRVVGCGIGDKFRRNRR